MNNKLKKYFLVYALFSGILLYNIHSSTVKQENKVIKEIQQETIKKEEHLNNYNKNNKREYTKKENKNKEYKKRYKNINEKTIDNLLNRISKINNNGIVVRVGENESVSLISLYYTGDMFKWKEFIKDDYADNMEIRKDPIHVYPNQKLYIAKDYLKEEIKNHLFN